MRILYVVFHGVRLPPGQIALVVVVGEEFGRMGLFAYTIVAYVAFFDPQVIVVVAKVGLQTVFAIRMVAFL